MNAHTKDPVGLPSKGELLGRIARLHAALAAMEEDWDAALICGKVNQYYLTGTMQNAVFVVKKDGSYAYFVRKSADRAAFESPLAECIRPMESYRDMSGFIGPACRTVLAELEVLPCAMLERIKRGLGFERALGLDRQMMALRSVKSPYELACMEYIGGVHGRFLHESLPAMLSEGMSESELTAKVYEGMVAAGHHGITRFGMFQNEMVVGQIAFGDSSIFPMDYDGPGGMRPISPAVPVVGSRERLLQKGDLVFIDIGFNYHGYHTDKTQLYMFGAPVPRELEGLQKNLVDVLGQTARLLRPGALPSEVYRQVMAERGRALQENFMGYGKHTVRFLGHGIGLEVDEHPVIAEGFDQPLQENMVLALEPKKGVEGIGLLGSEDTFVIKNDATYCITGGQNEIIVV